MRLRFAVRRYNLVNMKTRLALKTRIACALAAATALLIVFVSPALAADLPDYPVSAEFQALAAGYESMTLKGRIEVMPARIRAYVAAHPEDPLGHYLAGIAAMDRQEFDLALDSFGAALGLAPDLADAHAQSAAALLSSRRTDPAAAATATLDMAMVAASRAVAISPGRPDLRVIQSAAAFEAGRFDIAAQAMEACVLLAPGSVSFHIRLGTALLQSGAPVRAVRELNLAYILNSEANPQSLETRAEALDAIAPLMTRARRETKEAQGGLEAVNTLRKSKEYLQAAAAALELASQHPGDPEIQTVAAITRMEAFQDADGAAALLEKAIETDPLHVRAREALCGVREMQEKARAADNAQQPAIPFDWKQCMLDAADAGNAAALLDALYTDPERVEWLRKIGAAFDRFGRPDRALPYLHAAALLDPADTELNSELEIVRARALARIKLPSDER
jgi:tetratricopeptide (TPR) repeat protein